ncbi:hypothetical protein [Streptomyces sp. NPDC055992]|uniref:hypothetical protein n=1 Tax=Streptomyces sp. NPDC055992 TaxID=3345673 RepID=UPI0035E321AC
MTLRRHPRRAGDGGAPGRTAAGPTDVQVWHWAQSAVFGGYGPSASSFQPSSRLLEAPRTPADHLAP